MLYCKWGSINFERGFFKAVWFINLRCMEFSYHRWTIYNSQSRVVYVPLNQNSVHSFVSFAQKRTEQICTVLVLLIMEKGKKQQSNTCGGCIEVPFCQGDSARLLPSADYTLLYAGNGSQ